MGKLKPSTDVWLKKISKMLDSGDFDWAADNLKGISETIRTTKEVTTGQTTAILNIQRARK